jgi:L-seryl-tRNA(Ser) seleniumtransferase
MPQHPSRDIPSVDRLVRQLGDVALARPVVTAVVRRVVADERRRRGDGESGADVTAACRVAVDDLSRARLTPVINGTGILIHTNLGRSPLAAAAVDAVTVAAAGYTNLEIDLTTGERGGRAAYVEAALAVLCGAASATVANNCAAALVLALRAVVTQDRPEVVVSRGQLVQIGGGFRVPDILAASGATLREVGTTNRTTAADYAAATGPRTAMLLAVHRGNFYMAGFVADPTVVELSAVARQHEVPFMVDLGTGAVYDVQEHLRQSSAAPPRVPPSDDDDTDDAAQPAEREPTPAELMAAGVDLVCFSGDKLLGGPQAGVLAGRPDLIAAVKRDPLFRAMRCDKLVLAALEATVDLHLSGRLGELPIVRMMRATTDQLRARAEAIVEALDGVDVQVAAGRSQVGGGTMPRTVIPSVTLAVRPAAGSVDGLAAALRRGALPVVGYVANGRLRIDLRTVFPEQDATLTAAILAAIAAIRNA